MLYKSTIALIGVCLSSSVWAGQLDLTNTSGTGCDEQWLSDCISNEVWGPADSLSITTCDSEDVLYMHGVSSQATAVGFAKEPLNGATSLRGHATGYAENSNVRVKWQVKYFNASNTLVGSDELVVHSGAAGNFSGGVTFTGIPSSATQFSSRLVTHTNSGSGNALIWLAGCSAPYACYIPCYVDGQLVYYAEGWEGPGVGECNAVCIELGECDPDTMPE